MIRIRLSEQDTRLLEDEYRRAKDLAYRDRLLIIRLAARGRPHQEIAADLGISPRTVQRWLNRYLEHGLVGLRPRKARGAEAKVPADLAAQVRSWIIEGPQAQGLDRANCARPGPPVPRRPTRHVGLEQRPRQAASVVPV